MTLGEDGGGRARATYNYLRLIVVLPALWLLVSIIVVSFYRGAPYDSISDYYGGPIRDVFVGGLMACGVCMIAYKGHSRLEDYALNFAGLNAFFVALVANSFQSLLDDTRAAEKTTIAPPVPSAELLYSLRTTVSVLLVGVLVFIYVDRKYLGGTWFKWRDQTRTATALISVTVIGELVLLALVATMLSSDETIAGKSVFSVVHFLAATLLILNLSFAAATQAFAILHKEGRGPMDRLILTPEERQRRLLYFRIVTSAMWLGLLVGGVCIWKDVPYAVLVTEFWEIGLFVLFWNRATRHELDVPTPLLIR